MGSEDGSTGDQGAATEPQEYEGIAVQDLREVDPGVMTGPSNQMRRSSMTPSTS